jgi:hypothetical protein
MSKKINNSKLTAKLAMLITTKTGRADKVAVVANKVLADYWAARKIIAEYRQSFTPGKRCCKKRQAAVAKWNAEDELQKM